MPFFGVGVVVAVVVVVDAVVVCLFVCYSRNIFHGFCYTAFLMIYLKNTIPRTAFWCVCVCVCIIVSVCV